MKSCLIAPIGMSPPVVTEMFEYLIKVENKRVTDIVLIATDHISVKESARVVEVALEVHHPKTRVHTIMLPFSDITDLNDNIEFMRISASIIKEEKERYACDYIFLCVAGGRKDMCISLSLLGQLLGVDGVFHIINPDVEVFNQKLERIRKEMSELYDSDDPVSYYKEHQEKFDEVMFPPLNSFNVIRIPLVPMPSDYLGKVANILSLEYSIDKSETMLSENELKNLEKSGLIRIKGKKIYPTDFGTEIGKLWRK